MPRQVDLALFLLFQGLLMAVLGRAIWRSYVRLWCYKRFLGGSPSVTYETTRGERSWQKLFLGYSLSSLAVLQLVNAASCLEGFRLIVSIGDLGILLHLFVFNGWFKNKVLGVFAALRKRAERL